MSKKKIDKDPLIGKWELIQMYTRTNGRWGYLKLYDYDTMIWEFTETEHPSCYPKFGSALEGKLKETCNGVYTSKYEYNYIPKRQLFIAERIGIIDKNDNTQKVWCYRIEHINAEIICVSIIEDMNKEPLPLEAYDHKMELRRITQ